MWKKGREGCESGWARIRIKQIDLVRSNVVERLRLGAEKVVRNIIVYLPGCRARDDGTTSEDLSSLLVARLFQSE